jgi:hypothetical protein
MPTSTLPYEILFDFINDSSNPIILQSTTLLNDESVILLQPGDSVSLVLVAGTIYYYKVKEGRRQVQLS